MMDLNELKLDLDAVEEGVEFPFGEDCSILIARWGNEKHHSFLRNLYKVHGRKIESKAISDKQANALLVDQWPLIVLGWTGITEDGEELVYSRQAVIDLASNLQFSAFFDRIQALSQEESNFRKESIQELGND